MAYSTRAWRLGALAGLFSVLAVIVSARPLEVPPSEPSYFGSTTLHSTNLNQSILYANGTAWEAAQDLLSSTLSAASKLRSFFDIVPHDVKDPSNFTLAQSSPATVIQVTNFFLTFSGELYRVMHPVNDTAVKQERNALVDILAQSKAPNSTVCSGTVAQRTAKAALVVVYDTLYNFVSGIEAYQREWRVFASSAKEDPLINPGTVEPTDAEEQTAALLQKLDTLTEDQRLHVAGFVRDIQRLRVEAYANFMAGVANVVWTDKEGLEALREELAEVIRVLSERSDAIPVDVALAQADKVLNIVLRTLQPSLALHAIYRAKYSAAEDSVFFFQAYLEWEEDLLGVDDCYQSDGVADVHSSVSVPNNETGDICASESASNTVSQESPSTFKVVPPPTKEDPAASVHSGGTSKPFESKSQSTKLKKRSPSPTSIPPKAIANFFDFTQPPTVAILHPPSLVGGVLNMGMSRVVIA